VLTAALEDEEPLIRGHAPWALGRIGTAEALKALSERVDLEAESCVREEVEVALAR
jgi:epoxyqueuosine reductase